MAHNQAREINTNTEGQSSTVTRSDVISAYRFFFGRGVEDEATLKGKLALSLPGLIEDFVRSEEFRRETVEAASLAIPSGRLAEFLPEDHVNWARERLPLGEATSASLQGGMPRGLALAEVFTDPAFRAAIQNLELGWPVGSFARALTYRFKLEPGFADPAQVGNTEHEARRRLAELSSRRLAALFDLEYIESRYGLRFADVEEAIAAYFLTPVSQRWSPTPLFFPAALA